jgi:SHOCT-like protein
MSDEMNTVLRLVAEGKLSPEEAAPIIEALGQVGRAADRATQAMAMAGEVVDADGRLLTRGRGRRVRIQVNERGRRVVDVRVPLAFAAAAARMVPGIPESYAALIEQAVDSNTTGTIVEAEDETGDGVVISME